MIPYFQNTEAIEDITDLSLSILDMLMIQSIVDKLYFDKMANIFVNFRVNIRPKSRLYIIYIQYALCKI